MSIRPQYTYRQLTSDDATLLKELLRVFGHAFNDSETYQDAIPSDKYLTNLFGNDHFIVVVAMMEKVSEATGVAQKQVTRRASPS